MRKLMSAAAIGALVLMPALSFAGQSASKAKPAATAGKATAPSHSTNGTVKSVDATTLVIAKAGSKKGEEMTFVISPATQREGTVDVGSMVSVRYHTEGTQNMATAITAKPAKTTASSKKKG